MPLYKREEIDEDDENNTTTTTENLTPEEITFKKRYGDLRSYSQKQLNSKDEEIRKLREQLQATTSQTSLPKTKAEVEAWAAKYPDIFGLVKSIAMMEAGASVEPVQARMEEVKRREHANAVRAAEIELGRLHPDFFTEIKDSADFRTWLDGKSKRTQAALYENDTDAQAAAEVIDLYKSERGRTRKPADSRSAAAGVDTRSNRAPALGTEPLFTESQIARMNYAEYERNEEAINKAIREGRVEMDISGGAR